jgi:hypothetical protein
MSELIVVRNANIRKNLLATVSALALVAYTAAIDTAKAEDQDRPTVWIELGGQLERIDAATARFSPRFESAVEALPVTSPVAVQKPPAYGVGGEAKISIESDGSNWVYSAAIRYGRSNRFTHVQQTPSAQLVTGTILGVHESLFPRSPGIFASTQLKSRESHAVLDFEAGKDVGLGAWSHDATSVFSLGVRFAQFDAHSAVSIKAVPISVITPKHIRPKYHHSYQASNEEARSFRGLGPTLSWNASAPVAGNPDASITLDWGANVGVLFGRQKARGDHQTSGYYHCIGGFKVLGTAGCHGGIRAATGFNYISSYQHSTPHNRSRSIVVPNLGGFAGVSMRYSNAKLSLGYRGDFFFGALDGGIDTARRETVGFYGPFATISFGFGG